MSKPRSEEQKQAIIRMFHEGMGGKDIAAHLKASKNGVYKVLNEAGLIHPDNGRRNRFPGMVEKTIVEEYLVGSSLSELGRKHDCSLVTVRNIIKRHGEDCRPRGNRLIDLPEEEVDRIAARWLAGESQKSLAESYEVGHLVMCRFLAKKGITKEHKKAKGERHGRWKGGRIIVDGGYVAVLVPPEDPFRVMANTSSYVLEHRLVMARHLGRPLRSDETVHHKNRDRQNNLLDNLQLRQGQHGSGAAFRCRCCGSTDVEPVELDGE